MERVEAGYPLKWTFRTLYTGSVADSGVRFDDKKDYIRATKHKVSMAQASIASMVVDILQDMKCR